jgi:hypothetical protein
MNSTAPKENFFTRLAAGKLPSMDVNTEVGMTNASLLNLGAVIFLAGFLIVVAWWVFARKL